jgi:hypothetical protein
LVESRAKPCQIKFQAGQGLSELVVQFSRNSAAFLFDRSLRPASCAVQSSMSQVEILLDLNIRYDGSTYSHQTHDVRTSPLHPGDIP